MDPRQDLRQLVDALRASPPRSLTADEAWSVRQAWTDSTDALAMLLLLAHLYPEQREAEVTALAQRLARVAPSHSRIPETARLLARDLGRSGARSGIDRFRFLQLASRVHAELADMSNGLKVGAAYEVTVPHLSASYATAMRELIADPFVLPAV